MKIEFLTLPNGKSPAEAFLQQLDNKSVAKVFKLLERLEQTGRLTFPHARKLEGHKGLWELRVKTAKGAIRIFYVYWKQSSVILVSGFVKKSQKTPKRELEKAVNYLKQGGILV